MIVARPKYQPDSVCTCPYFVTSHFFANILSSLWDPYHPLSISKCNTIGQHPSGFTHSCSLKVSTTASGSSKTLPTLDANMIEQDESDDENDGLIDTEPEWTTECCHEWLDKHIKAIRDFCDGLEYQLQFNDHRMLVTVEREGGSFLQLAESCLSHKHLMNSSRGATPTGRGRQQVQCSIEQGLHIMKSTVDPHNHL